MICVGLGFKIIPNMLGLKENHWRREGLYVHLERWWFYHTDILEYFMSVIYRYTKTPRLMMALELKEDRVIKHQQ